MLKDLLYEMGREMKILATLDTKTRNVKPEADVQIVVCQLNTDFAFDIGTSKGTNIIFYSLVYIFP